MAAVSIKDTVIGQGSSTQMIFPTPASAQLLRMVFRNKTAWKTVER